MCECVDGHGEFQHAAVEGLSLHREVWGPHGDPVPSRPRRGHSDTAAKTQRWRGLAEQPAHLSERDTEAVEVSQPLRFPLLAGRGRDHKSQTGELGARPGSWVPS